MTDLPLLDLRTRREWRAWLAKNHTSSRGIWFVFHKRHTNVKSIPLEEVQREALCFGWIDSLIKRLDEDRYALKVTPRKPTSKWSALNRKRWAELKAEGLLAPAGLAAGPTENTYAEKPKIPELPAYIAKGIKTNPKAWEVFRALPPSCRRNYVAWIHTAKREETRGRRLNESIELLSKGKRLGLK